MSIRLEPLGRVPAPEPGEFWSVYVRRREPVIFTGLARNWAALNEWSIPYFIQSCGTCTWPTVSLPAPGPTASTPKGPVIATVVVEEFLRRVLEEKTSELMMVPFEQLPRPVREQAALLPCFEKTVTARQTLFINKRGSQSPLHFDKTNNLITQVHGVKDVRIFSLFQAKYLGFRGMLSPMPNISGLDPWQVEPRFEARFAKAQGFHGVLNPGDTLYLPLGWWHALKARDASITTELSWEVGWERLLFAAGGLFKRLRGLKY